MSLNDLLSTNFQASNFTGDENLSKFEQVPGLGAIDFDGMTGFGDQDIEGVLAWICLMDFSSAGEGVSEMVKLGRHNATCIDVILCPDTWWKKVFVSPHWANLLH